MTGIPVEFEKRTLTGVDGLFKCAARLSEAASAVGVNVPDSRMPLAWAGRKPGWSPKIESKVWMMSLLSARIFSSVGSGMREFLFRKRFGGSGLGSLQSVHSIDSRKIRCDCEFCK